MKLGIFGGSFDPIHIGHLLLAETCREACELDKVLFIPAAVPPHKPDRVLASDKHRVEMIKLALAGNPSFQLSTLELERGGVSYTVDTLTNLQEENPDDELFLLMGGDSLDEFSTWKDPERICELAVPLVVGRSGSPPPDVKVLAAFCDKNRIAEIEQYQVEFPMFEISSTELRERVNSRRSIRYRTPRAVEIYIQQQQVYR